jgi:hypothetical protein
MKSLCKSPAIDCTTHISTHIPRGGLNNKVTKRVSHHQSQMALVVGLDEDESPILDQDEEEILYSSVVRLFDGNTDKGRGRLWITNRRLVWVAEGNLETGLGKNPFCLCLHLNFTLTVHSHRQLLFDPFAFSHFSAWFFRGLALHAISRASESFPYSCVYCQLAVLGEDEENENAPPPGELRLVPENDLGALEFCCFCCFCSSSTL